MVDADVARQAASAPKRPKGKASTRARAKLRWDSLFHWNDLPEYLKDNEYIYTGYRVHTGVLGSFKSLFRIHNESGNVWTHLLGTRCLPMPLPHEVKYALYVHAFECIPLRMKASPSSCKQLDTVSTRNRFLGEGHV